MYFYVMVTEVCRIDRTVLTYAVLFVLLYTCSFFLPTNVVINAVVLYSTYLLLFIYISESLVVYPIACPQSYLESVSGHRFALSLVSTV